MEASSKVVFIGNLSWTTNNDQLFEFLSTSGNVSSAQVQRHEDTNRSKGWGLAEFFTHEDAKRAVDLLDKTEFGGRQIHMRLDRSHLDCNDNTYSIYVGNLAWSVVDKDLLGLFSSFSPIGCHVLTNMYGRSRGFAIVRFTSEIDALNAIEYSNDVEFCGRKLECRFDRGPVKPDDTDGKSSIFVNKLDPSIVTDSDLIAMFRHIGPIASAALQKASNGRSKGWGVVKFHTYADAKHAVENMNGIRLHNFAFPLEVRFDRK